MTAEITLSKISVEDAIEKLVAPTGNRIKVVHIKDTSLYELQWLDGGRLPTGDKHNLAYCRWTKPELAIADARNYLRDLWAISEASKNPKPLSDKARGVTRNKKQDQSDEAEVADTPVED